MRIVIYGGTFDPVHSEHVKLARGALRELSPDKLIIIPSYVPPHKAEATATAEHRLAMAEIAFGRLDRTEISDYEILRGGSSYTYLTIRHFRSLYPGAEIIFLIGGDSFYDFEGWVNPDDIAANCRIAVVSRGEFTEKLIARNAEFERLHGYKAKILSFTGDATSSTYLRACLMLGVGGDEVPAEVLDYINQNGLYHGDRVFEFIRSKKLKPKRLIHTAGVIECALALNSQLKLDRQKIITACALHDVAKYLSADDYPDFTVPEGMHESVVHAFLGEYVVRTELGITDEDVLSAIRYHTTGRADMSALEKLVYVADLIERGRSYTGVDKLRKLVYENFEKGFKECVTQGYKHLKQQLRSGEVYYLTDEAYKFYK